MKFSAEYNFCNILSEATSLLSGMSAGIFIDNIERKAERVKRKAV